MLMLVAIPTPPTLPVHSPLIVEVDTDTQQTKPLSPVQSDKGAFNQQRALNPHCLFTRTCVLPLTVCVTVWPFSFARLCGAALLI